jgi:hypothetical protein
MEVESEVVRCEDVEEEGRRSSGQVQRNGLDGISRQDFVIPGYRAR